MYFKWPHIFFFFYIHHILSELYAPQAIYGPEQSRPSSLTFSLRALFHSLAYAHVLTYPHAQRFGEDRLFILFCAFCLVAAIYFYKTLREFQFSKASKDIFFAEALVLVLVILNFLKVLSFGFYEILFYHFTYWTLVPIPNLLAQSRQRLLNYFLLTAGLFFLCFSLVYSWSLSKQVLFGSALSVTALSALNLFGYFHISTSFGLSKSNPKWIQKIFSW
jgi:hypothetical protein